MLLLKATLVLALGTKPSAYARVLLEDRKSVV